MLTVELRVDIGGADFIPHSFLVVTGPDGIARGYGLAPAEHQTLAGAGHIFDDTDHPYTTTTGKLELTPGEYGSLVSFINQCKRSLNPVLARKTKI